jgi:hypothetical protein
VSADGLTKSVQLDSTGDGTFDHTQTDAIVVNADGSRAETIADLNSDGSIRDRSWSGVALGVRLTPSVSNLVGFDANGAQD